MKLIRNWTNRREAFLAKVRPLRPLKPTKKTPQKDIL